MQFIWRINRNSNDKDQLKISTIYIIFQVIDFKDVDRHIACMNMNEIFATIIENDVN